MNTSTFSFYIGIGMFVGQRFDVFGGLFLLLIGSAMFYAPATSLFRGVQLDGEIVGVRRRGSKFHGVYRYMLDTFLFPVVQYTAEFKVCNPGC